MYTCDDCEKWAAMPFTCSGCGKSIKRKRRMLISTKDLKESFDWVRKYALELEALCFEHGLFDEEAK
jgi:hypothetical protein